MAASVTNRRREISDLVALLEAAESKKPCNRGVKSKQREPMKLGFLGIVAVFLSAQAVIGQGGTVYTLDAVDSIPILVKEVKPTYTAEARKARIQGTVFVSAVVLSDGTVGDVTVTRSLDTKFGLDRQAVNAAKQWLCKPGKKNGKAVAVRVSLELTFVLKDST